MFIDCSSWDLLSSSVWVTMIFGLYTTPQFW